MRVVRRTALFLRSEKGGFCSPSREIEVAAPLALHGQCSSMRCCQKRGYSLSEEGIPFDSSPSRGGAGGCSALRCIVSAALCAAARQRGYSLSEENTPFGTPRERRGESPSTPDLGSLQLEGLHALRSAGAVYVASPRVFCGSLPLATAPYSVGRE